MRRGLPLLIVLSLGFAPAPVYRERPANPLTAENLAGRWRFAEDYCHPNREAIENDGTGRTHVVIRPGAWSFIRVDREKSYDLRIDTGKPVVEFDLHNPGDPKSYGRGIIRREGRAIRVIYQWDDGRPTGFGAQKSGFEMLLVRE